MAIASRVSGAARSCATALTVLAATAAGVMLPLAPPAAAQVDPFAITPVRSQLSWTSGAGVGAPFSYNCPPTMDGREGLKEAPASYAALAAGQVLPGAFTDAVQTSMDVVLERWLTDYRSGLSASPPRIPAFPPDLAGASEATIKEYLKGQVAGALTSQAFWSGVIQRLGNVPKPAGANVSQFLAVAPELTAGYSSPCGYGSKADGRSLRIWQATSDLFLQDEETGDFARVVYGDTPLVFNHRTTLRVVPGAQTPTWLVLTPSTLSTSRVEGLLRIPGDVVHEHCGPDTRSATEIHSSVTNQAQGTLQQLVSWANWIPLISITVPDYLPDCPFVRAQYAPFTTDVDFEPLSLQISDDARYLAGWRIVNGQPAVVRYRRSADTLVEPTVVFSGFRLDGGFDGYARLALSSDGQTLAGCHIGLSAETAARLPVSTEPRFPAIVHVPSQAVGWPANGQLNSSLFCDYLTFDSSGTRLFWAQGGNTPGWFSVEARPPGAVPPDTVAPSVTATPDRAPNAAGWYREPFTIAWDATDPTPSSGTPTTPAPTLADVEGTEVTYRSSASCDPAGNCQTGSFTASLDRTPPTVRLVGPADGSTIPATEYQPPTCEATDALSGIDGDCYLQIVQTNDTPGAPVYRATASATDRAGNQASSTVTYTVITDSQAPTITATPDRAPNAAGWYRGPVTFSFNCSDDGGVLRCPTPTTVSSEGASQSLEVTAEDNVGNVARLSVGPINIDRTPPTVRFSGNAGIYLPTQTVSIRCASADELSGIASTDCQTLIVAADTLPIGRNTVSASATDRAGNRTANSTRFELRVTRASIRSLIDRYLPAAVSGNGAIARSLKEALASRDSRVFNRRVRALEGRRLTSQQVRNLIRFAEAL